MKRDGSCSRRFSSTSPAQRSNFSCQRITHLLSKITFTGLSDIFMFSPWKSVLVIILVMSRIAPLTSLHEVFQPSIKVSRINASHAFESPLRRFVPDFLMYQADLLFRGERAADKVLRNSWQNYILLISFHSTLIECFYTSYRDHFQSKVTQIS